MCRMTRCCDFLVFIWVAGLQLTSCNIINKAYPEDGIPDLIKEAQDFRDAGEAPYKLSHKGLFDRLQNFIKEKNLVQGCTEEATKKTKHMLKEREEKDKTILKKNYQILQHGEESFASTKEWLSVIRSGICTGCLVKKICSHPPSFLSKYVSFSSWKSPKLRLLYVKLLFLRNLHYFLFQNAMIMPQVRWPKNG